MSAPQRLLPPADPLWAQEVVLLPHSHRTSDGKWCHEDLAAITSREASGIVRGLHCLACGQWLPRGWPMRGVP